MAIYDCLVFILFFRMLQILSDYIDICKTIKVSEFETHIYSYVWLPIDGFETENDPEVSGERPGITSKFYCTRIQRRL